MLSVETPIVPVIEKVIVFVFIRPVPLLRGCVGFGDTQ